MMNYRSFPRAPRASGRAHDPRHGDELARGKLPNGSSLEENPRLRVPQVAGEDVA
jgi:hypothetical protein